MIDAQALGIVWREDFTRGWVHFVHELHRAIGRQPCQNTAKITSAEDASSKFSPRFYMKDDSQARVLQQGLSFIDEACHDLVACRIPIDKMRSNLIAPISLYTKSRSYVRLTFSLYSFMLSLTE